MNNDSNYNEASSHHRKLSSRMQPTALTGKPKAAVRMITQAMQEAKQSHPRQKQRISMAAP